MQSAEPEKRLFAAVVALAVRDTMIDPIKPEKTLELTATSKSAFDFLFTDLSDGYLDLLEMNPSYFKRQLLDVMFDQSSKDTQFTSFARRKFRINYKLWRDEYDRLGGRVLGAKEDDESTSRKYAQEGI